MTAKLTQEQREALQRQPGQPIEVEDDQDHTIYVLVARDQYRQAHGDSVDREKIKQAILARRDESRELNREWGHADRDVWEAPSSQ
ncbi:MAG: hypothetical protein OES79_09720 [Planctomycetota bacterium]|nr:hypothetical protein [Planctomycetota bacterium]